MVVLIDGGESHNFIDIAMISKWTIPTEDFDGFTVPVAWNKNMECTPIVSPSLM